MDHFFWGHDRRGDGGKVAYGGGMGSLPPWKPSPFLLRRLPLKPGGHGGGLVLGDESRLALVMVMHGSSSRLQTHGGCEDVQMFGLGSCVSWLMVACGSWSRLPRGWQVGGEARRWMIVLVLGRVLIG